MTARTIKHLVTMTTLAAALAAAGCSGGSTDSGSDNPYNPQIPTNWVSAVTNPYFPLVTGTTYQYQGQTAEGVETVTVEVLPGTKMVNGVAATIVRDRVYLDGALIEDTADWYAQDGAGNVWYLGEDSKEIANGVVVGTEGSWEWEVDDALPGIIMWGDPAAHVGEEYRQEFYEGEAEDWAKIVAVDQSVDVPEGNFTGCIKIEEWSGLEPSQREYKFFGPQIGNVLEISTNGERSELVSRTTP